MKKYIVLLLMLLADSTANATNNTYDNSTGILTIPSVTVGNTTYTNVVIQENSFTVLSYDPYPSVGQVVGGVLYNFNGCYRQGSTLTCNLALTSQNKTVNEYMVMCNGYGLTDDRGNHYPASSIQIANITFNSCQTSFDPILAANVTTAVQVVFTNIATNATSMAQLSLVSNGNGTAINFTNSPFINSAPPNPF